MAIGPTLVSFNFGSLSAWYSTGASMGATLHAEKLRQGILKNLGQAPVAVPPWQQAPAGDERLADRVLRTINKPLIDMNDPTLERDGLSGDYRKLFALYKGVARLHEMAEFARSDPRGEALRGLLDRRFQSLMSEYFSFMQTLELDDATLIGGLKLPSQTSPVSFKEPAATYVGGPAATARDEAVPGLAGDEKFTIRIDEGGTSTDLLIDLAQVGGSRSLDDIADYINAQLAAVGTIATNVEVHRKGEFDFRLQVNLSEGEQISFIPDPASQTPAVYVAGTVGGGELSSGFLRKFEDIASEPAESFLRRIDSDKADSAAAVAVDGKGNVWVVGSTAGDLDGQINTAGQDVYLRKYDPSGREIFTRLLGATDLAAGVALAIDADDNIIVAGRTTAPLTELAYGGGGDAFVTKFDEAGEEVFTRQAAPMASDGALGVSVDAAGSIFVTGYAEAAVGADVTHGGGKDAFVTKLGADGALQYHRQFGGTGDEVATAVTADDAGSLYVLYNAHGHAYLRKFADEAASAPLFETDLGALGEGQALALARDGQGAIFVAGHTQAGSLNGTVADAYSGGGEGFITRLDEATGAISWVSYLGTAADDRATGIVAHDGRLYVTGSTGGQLGGATRHGELDGFLARLDAGSGILQTAQQFGGAFEHRPAAIAFDPTGTSVLSRLGLPNGVAPAAMGESLAALTTARPGQSFTVSVNNEPAKRITLQDGDTPGFLAFRIKQALGRFGEARLVPEGDGRALKITALDGAAVTIGPGLPGQDLLGPLGLRPGTIYGEPMDKEKAGKRDPSVFELGLLDNFSLKSAQSAGAAYDVLDNALLELRNAYRFITEGPQETPPPTGPAPAYLSKQIAAYKDALQKIAVFNGQA